MENPPKQPKYALPHLRELDGVRGIAVLLVFFHHLCFTSIQPKGWNSVIVSLYGIFRYGMVGVDIFFVLSGFLITSILIRNRQSQAYYQDFYWKRALRILPIYLLCMVGVLLFIPGSKGFILLSALFLANFANVFHVVSSGPFWSLAIEEQFYLIWPTVVRRRSVKNLGWWAAGIMIAVFVARLAAASIGHHNYFLTFFRCDGLAFGALLACRYQQKQGKKRRDASDSLVLIGATVLGGIFYAAGLKVYPFETNTAFGAALLQTGVVLICGGLVGLVIENPGSALFAPLRSRFLTFFGLISYALYMVQLYVMAAYDHFRGPLVAGYTTDYFLRLFGVLAITIAVCLITRYLVELPALSLRNRVLLHPTESIFHEPLSRDN